MKLAMAQMSMSESMEENYSKSVNYIRDAARYKAKIICFPEVQLSPFFPQYEKRDASKYCIDLNSEYVKGMCRACEKYKIFACPNFYVEENGHRYDMSIFIDDMGKIIGKQKMVHIAQCKNFFEQDYYEPSDEGFNVIDTKLGKIAVVVCFDRHYPESVRTAALKGAELIIIPTANTTDEPGEIFMWEVKIQAFQSIVNIAMCNRVGIEGKMAFSGNSLAADYNGNTIDATRGGETLLLVNIDMKGVANERKRRPYTSLRRPELYL